MSLRRNDLLRIVAGTACSALTFVATADITVDDGNGNPTQSAQRAFLDTNPGATFYQLTPGRVTTVYGSAFSRGATSEESAEAFVGAHARLFGVEPVELLNHSLLADQRPTQGVMVDRESGEYKFNMHYYAQYRDGVPVFRSELRLLVRNQADHPLVLAKSALRDLGHFHVPDGAEAMALTAVQSQQVVRTDNPGLVRFGQPRMVVWAGVDDMVVEPRVALEFVARGADLFDPTYEEFQFVIDAFTGEILYEEDQIHNIDVAGNVSANATTGMLPAENAPEAVTAMQYARVAIGGNVDFADVNGDYNLSNGGSGDVTVNSQVRGEWFRVFNEAGTDTSLNQTVTPPGPADFLHNQSGSEIQTAEVNAYIQSNIVRDFVLDYMPSFPSISTETAFTVNVNLNNNCNAFYSSAEQSINFYTSGGGCPNTAYSSIVHHEYGHRIVNAAGSGQGEYGEGYGDCMSVVILDDSGLAYGFNGNPAVPLRNADNNINYPCTGGIHSCGRVLSGSVWETRNELVSTEPVDYQDIIGGLTVNSVLLHTGSAITPQITIDFLTLDDDDSDIFNGTPHYTEIATGFGEHNLDAPPLALIGFEFPDGRPDLLDPSGGVAFTVEVVGVGGSPQSGTGELSYRLGSSGSFTTVSMNEISTNVYEASFPSFDCGDPVEYYVSADASNGFETTSPNGAPGDAYNATSATESEISFDDDFEASNGWTVGGTGDDASTGIWERGDPNGTAAQPADDQSSDGNDCFFTGQGSPGGGLGENDVDGGQTTLMSPTLALSDVDGAKISYYRWYSNDTGAAPNADVFVVDVSSNGGSSWTNVETIGPSGPGTSGGWIYHEFAVGDLVALTDDIVVRFIASDEGSGSLVEAAIDEVMVTTFSCGPVVEDPCDWDGNGTVNSSDFFGFLDDFVTGNADFDGNGTTNSSDFFGFLGECL